MNKYTICLFICVVLSIGVFHFYSFGFSPQINLIDNVVKDRNETIINITKLDKNETIIVNKGLDKNETIIHHKELDKNESIVINKDSNENQNSDKFNFVQPTFKDHQIDTTKFNYEGKCQDVFISKSNNKRDLLFLGTYFERKNDWITTKETTLRNLRITNSGIPNATKVIMLYGEEPEEGFVKLLNECGFEVIKSKREAKHGCKFCAALYRFLDVEEYLNDHKGEFDRVALNDFRDVAWFSDGFATIKEKELFVSGECYGKEIKCQSVNIEWMRTRMIQSYGQEIQNQLDKIGGNLINIGMVMGDTESIMSFLSIYNSEARKAPQHFPMWGFDQMVVNVIYHFGMLKHLNITENTLSQRYGFGMYDGSILYDSESKIIYDINGTCSPVIRHKIKGLFL